MLFSQQVSYNYHWQYSIQCSKHALLIGWDLHHSSNQYYNQYDDSHQDLPILSCSPCFVGDFLCNIAQFHHPFHDPSRSVWCQILLSPGLWDLLDLWYWNQNSSLKCQRLLCFLFRYFLYYCLLAHVCVYEIPKHPSRTTIMMRAPSRRCCGHPGRNQCSASRWKHGQIPRRVQYNQAYFERWQSHARKTHLPFPSGQLSICAKTHIVRFQTHKLNTERVTITPLPGPKPRILLRRSLSSWILIKSRWRCVETFQWHKLTFEYKLGGFDVLSLPSNGKYLVYEY